MAIMKNIFSLYLSLFLLYEATEKVSAPNPKIINEFATAIEIISGTTPLKINKTHPVA